MDIKNQLKSKLTIMLLLFFIHQICFVFGAKRETFVRILRTNCTGNSDFLTIDLCEVKRVKRKHGNFNYGVTLHRPVEQLMLCLAVLYQTPQNLNTVMRFTDINLCDIKSSNLDKVLELLPFVKKILERAIQPCPYQGAIEVRDLIIDYFEESVYRTILRTGNYIIELNFTDGIIKETFFQIHVLLRFDSFIAPE